MVHTSLNGEPLHSAAPTMKDVTKGTPRTRHDVQYEIALSAVELDLIYELARQARNELTDPDDIPEHGSWAANVIELDNKFTTFFRKRR